MLQQHYYYYYYCYHCNNCYYYFSYYSCCYCLVGGAHPGQDHDTVRRRHRSDDGACRKEANARAAGAE